MEIIEPDKNAKPEVIENKYFNEENFEESEPELYKKYALESPPSRVFQVIKYRDYIWTDRIVIGGKVWVSKRYSCKSETLCM